MMALGNIIRRFVRGTAEMTEGFDRVFGPQRRASRVSKEKAGRRVARLSPRARRRGRLRIADVGQDRDRKRKLFDMDRNRERRFF